MVYDTETGVSGAMAGASVGATAGPWGALAGGIAGGAMGFMKKKSGSLYDRDLLARRAREIDSFSMSLAAARQKYLTSLGTMYNDAYSRFVPDAEAAFAARGFSPVGGAFQSALGKEAARYQSELTPAMFEAEREDLTNVENLRGSLFGAEFGADMGERQARYTSGREDSRALGQLGGQSLLALLQAKFGGAGGGKAPLYGGEPSMTRAPATRRRSLNLGGGFGMGD